MKSQPISNLFPNDPNAIFHARESAATIVLRAAHNALAPVSRLPSEALARIFLFCAEMLPPSMDHGPEEHWSVSDESDEPYKPKPIDLGWLQVTHVCKSWRQTALHYPHIWTKIRGLSVPWMQAALARGRSVPISVSFGQFEPISLELDCTPTAAHGQEIVKHASRIRNISLWVDAIGMIRILEPMVASPAEILQSLKLRNRGPYIWLSVDMFGAHAPALRSVDLCNILIPWSAPILRNLTNLTVFLNEEPIPFQLDEILCGLRNMSALQKLDLSRCLPPISRPSTVGSVNLPILKTLRLSDEHATRCTNFLECLKIPSSCSLCLRYPHNSNRGQVSELDTLFHEHVTREQGPLQSLSLDVNNFEFSFHVSRMDSDGETEVTHTLENRCLVDLLQESPPMSLDTTTAWCHRFPTETLRRLHVVLTWRDSFYATPQEWIDAFGQCMALEEAEIAGRRRTQTVAFFTALTICMPQDGTCKDMLFLPNLRHLTMHRPWNSFDDLQEGWLRHLDARQKVKPIQTVCIAYLERSKCEDMFVAELERIVPEVKWLAD